MTTLFSGDLKYQYGEENAWEVRLGGSNNTNTNNNNNSSNSSNSSSNSSSSSNNSALSHLLGTASARLGYSSLEQQAATIG